MGIFIQSSHNSFVHAFTCVFVCIVLYMNPKPLLTHKFCHYLLVLHVCVCVFLGVNMMLRMIAVKAASRPVVEITQDGETLSIKTSTTVRTTHITFTVGQEFNEATVDGRPCTV